VELRRIAPFGAALIVLTGCGGDHGWSDAQCRGQAQKLAVRAESMVQHYHGSTVYPADMSYLGFRDGLVLFEKRRCEPRELGVALRRELGTDDRATLLRLLPGRIAGAVRRALAD
jgi:hypothetical protein